LCDKLGKPEWKTDARFVTNALRVKNRDTLDLIIEDDLKTKTTKEWLDMFEGSGMPYAAVNDIQGTLNHEHGTSHMRLIPTSIILAGMLGQKLIELQCSRVT
jgi:crotonobetainyl-CoA:carnitine CoA-transferase CaiB-like acyl-CoA transferase